MRTSSAACPGCLERQDILAALADDLSGDSALAVERVGGDGPTLEREQPSSLGTAVISFDLPSTASWPSTRRCSQAQALTMCRGESLAAVSNERQRVLPSIATTPGRSGKALHEGGEAGPELLGIEPAKDPAEGVVAGHAVRQAEELPQEGPLHPPEQRHVGTALAAAEHSAQSNQQDFQKQVALALPVRGSSSPAEASANPSTAPLLRTSDANATSPVHLEPQPPQMRRPYGSPDHGLEKACDRKYSPAV